MAATQAQLERTIILWNKLRWWREQACRDASTTARRHLVLETLEKQWAHLPQELRDAVEKQVPIPFIPREVNHDTTKSAIS